MSDPTKRGAGILILEGADCSGKTTLAHAIATNVMENGGDFLYLHGSPWPGRVVEEHQRMAQQANDAINRGNTFVVIDHFWIAEQIYGAVYRGGPGYDNNMVNALDKTMNNLGALIILCVPTNLEAQIERHLSRFIKGGEHFGDASKVVARYSDLWHGNLAHPGNSYIDKFIQHQDFKLRADVVRYDMDANKLNKMMHLSTMLVGSARVRRKEKMQ